MKKRTLHQFKQCILAFGIGLLLYSGTHAFAAKPDHAGGGNGGGDDSGDSLLRGRADFMETEEFNITDDGAALCDDGIGIWDYWDPRDTADCTLADETLYVEQSDFNSVGRWIFSTGYTSNSFQRYLIFHWQPVDGSSPLDPRMDDRLVPDIADPTPGVDNLRVRINAYNLFKEGEDRQPTVIDLWRSIEGQIGRPVELRYKEDLYIQRPAPGIAVLTTEGQEFGQPNVRIAELMDLETKGKNRLVGTYDMPMTIIVRQVTVE